MTGFVYFIKPVGMTGPIKIGHSKSPLARLNTLSTWSPFELEIVVTVAGTSALEKQIHGAFHQDRTHREWFMWSARLQNLMDKLRAGIAIGNAIDLTVAHPRHSKWTNVSADDRECAHYNLRIAGACRRGARLLGLFSLEEPTAVTEAMKVWRGNYSCGRSIRGPKPQQNTLAIVDAFCRSPHTFTSSISAAA